MQGFKTLLIVALLSAVSYGVYAALTGAHDVGPPPGVSVEDWSNAPEVELPDVTPGQPSGPPSHVAAPAAPHVVQPQPVTTDAPRYDAPPPQDSGAAPPFVAPSVGPSAPAAPLQEAPPPVGQDSASLPLTPGQLAPVAEGAATMPQQDALAPSSVAAAGGVLPENNFNADFVAAQGLLQEQKLDAALVMLSRWYDDPQLTEAEHQGLLHLLNQLAGTVIYSGEHYLVPPYEVQAGDSLDRVAQHYQVPWQLLAKINGVQDPNQLQPGQRLKVVQGPFDAVVNLRTQTLTLTLAGRFAGRFPIAAGPEQATPDGDFTVKIKTPNPTYYGADRVIDGSDPNNPLGKYWIGLDDHLGIHGTNDQQAATGTDSRGIRLNSHDIEDVYDMLTVESHVRILR